LQAQGIPCVRLSEDEIWDRIRDRAIDRFTKATVGFIGRCRKQSLSESELRSLINGHSPLSPVEEIFLNLAHRLYVSYLDRLSATGEDDFDGLMQRAADSISAGQTLFQRLSGSGDLALLRYVCIDEFQDFSDLFYRLLNAIRKQNPRVELFCVGDDWQAINGFAGSDIRFFENFTAHIGKSRRLYISTNYRSSKAIVNIGNALMVGLGKPAIAHKKSTGKVFSFDLNKFEPSKLEEERHGRGDNITPAVLRLTSKALADGLDVVMLCRHNAIPWFVNYQDQEGGDGRGLARYLDLIRSFFPKGMKERISISTAHKYKGLEKPMVIVLDAVARSYPLIHPDWAFSRVLGDSPEKITKEERRLFYVALTRAIEKLVIITDGRSKSPFLEELERRHPSVLSNGRTTRLFVVQ
jgi:DNA helicase IV